MDKSEEISFKKKNGKSKGFANPPGERTMFPLAGWSAMGTLQVTPRMTQNPCGLHLICLCLSWPRAHQSLNAAFPASQAGLGCCKSLSQSRDPCSISRESQPNTSLLASVFIQQFQKDNARYCSIPNQKLSCKIIVQLKMKVAAEAESKAK